MILILGAGVSGLSCGYHLRELETCTLEASDHIGGHASSHFDSGFFWDEGPHICFTKHGYVRELFQQSCAVVEYDVEVGNYFRGNWIPHPVQANLVSVPEPIRSECVAAYRSLQENARPDTPTNFESWLINSFGRAFYDNFSRPYNLKYWTIDPSLLGTDWIGQRIFRCPPEIFLQGSVQTPPVKSHYITHALYPQHGGFAQFVKSLDRGQQILLNKVVTRIDLACKVVECSDGSCYRYSRLISSLPLPEFIKRCVDVPAPIREAARGLFFTSLRLINVTFRSTTRSPFDWWYSHDESMLASRITSLSRIQRRPIAQGGLDALQVEVYHSHVAAPKLSDEQLIKQIVLELAAMGVLEPSEISSSKVVTIPYANVGFTLGTRSQLDSIFHYLEKFGLIREADDLNPVTEWSTAPAYRWGDLALAGRFGQWKYFWTDDCVLRGRQLAGMD